MGPIQFSGQYGIVYKVFVPNNETAFAWEDNDQVLQAEQRIKQEAKQQNLSLSIRVDDFVESDENGHIKSITQGLAVFTEEEKTSYDKDMAKARFFSVIGFLLPAFISKGIQKTQQVLGLKTMDFDAADKELGQSMDQIQNMVKNASITTENMQDSSGQLSFDLKTGETL